MPPDFDLRELAACVRAGRKATARPWKQCEAKGGRCPCRQVWSHSQDVIVAVALRASDEDYTAGEGCTTEQAIENGVYLAAAANLADRAALHILREMAEASCRITLSRVGMNPECPCRTCTARRELESLAKEEGDE